MEIHNYGVLSPLALHNLSPYTAKFDESWYLKGYDILSESVFIGQYNGIVCVVLWWTLM